MVGIILTTLITALSLLVVDLVVPGVGIATFPAALGAALSLGLVNGSIKPVAKLLSLPVNILTLGSFSLVINGFCFWLASLVVPGFTVHGLLGFILGPIALSLVTTFVTGYFVKHQVAEKLEGVAAKLGLASAAAPVTESAPIEAAPQQEALDAGHLS